MKRNKLFYKFALLYLILCCGGVLQAQKQAIQVIGVYSHWENTKCAQGCENIDLAHYMLVEPLKDLPLWTTGKTVFVEGNFKMSDQEYVIAGLHPDMEHVGKTYELNKIEVAQYKIFDFVTAKVDSLELEKIGMGEDFTIVFNFKNPSDQEIALKAKINEGEYIEFLLPASGSYEMEYTTTVNDFNAYELSVVNDSAGSLTSKKRFKKAEAKGFVVHYIKIYEFMLE